jgi:hypothetical protein
MATGARSRRGLALAVGAVLVLGGCSSGGGGSDNNTPKPAPSPTATKNADAACSNVVTKGRALASTVAQFVGGQASASDVKTAANQLSTAVDKAKAQLKPEVSKNLDSAQSGVQRLQKALTTQPVSKSEIGSAAAQVVTSVSSAATVCKTS